jgi:hypothetical protein
MANQKLTKIRISKKTLRKLKGKPLDINYDGVPGGIRTHDPLLRRQPLYPLSYRDSYGV